MARNIAAKSLTALRGSLRAIREAGLTLQEGLALEARLFGGLCETEDKREGVPPSWRNGNHLRRSMNVCAGDAVDPMLRARWHRHAANGRWPWAEEASRAISSRSVR